MNAQSAPINATVILRDENDYRTWYNQLQARCEAYKVWAQVDPDSIRLAISQVTQSELTELTAKTQFSQSVLEAAGHQSSQFRGLQTD